MKIKIKVRKATLAEVYKVHKQITEFTSNSYPPNTLDDFKKEVQNSEHLNAVAFIGDKMVGYSVCYDKYKDGSLYAWMGGVVPKYRKMGVFKSLSKYQENWAKKRSYKKMIARTWNKRVGMRIALTKLGYNIEGFEKKPKVKENRLIYTKEL